MVLKDLLQASEPSRNEMYRTCYGHVIHMQSVHSRYIIDFRSVISKYLYTKTFIQKVVSWGVEKMADVPEARLNRVCTELFFDYFRFRSRYNTCRNLGVFHMATVFVYLQARSYFLPKLRFN